MCDGVYSTAHHCATLQPSSKPASCSNDSDCDSAFQRSTPCCLQDFDGEFGDFGDMDEGMLQALQLDNMLQQHAGESQSLSLLESCMPIMHSQLDRS